MRLTMGQWWKYKELMVTVPKVILINMVAFW